MAAIQRKTKFKKLPREEKDIAVRIADCRRYKGYTQEQIAGLLEITRDQMASIETGRVAVSFGLALKIADGLGVNLRWLAEGIKPAFWTVVVPSKAIESIDKYSGFLFAYNLHLRGFFAKAFTEIEADFQREFTDSTYNEVIEMLGTGGTTAADRERLVSHLLPVLSDALQQLPPRFQYELAMQVGKMLVEFVNANKGDFPQFSWSHSQAVTAGSRNEKKKYWQPLLDVKTSSLYLDGVKAKVPRSLTELIDVVRNRVKNRGEKAALAVHCQVSRQAVDQWLSGKAKPSPDTMFKLFEWLGII